MRYVHPKKFTSFFLVLIAFIALVVVLDFISKHYISSKIPPFPSLFPDTGDIVVTPYVSANGTKLYVNGQEYKFTGVNAFHLGTNPGTNAGCGGFEPDLDAFFYQLRPNSTVRMWAFQGGMATNVTTKQIDWTGLDRVVAAAEKNQIKLILVLGDQSGTCDDGHWKDKSWYETGYKQAFNDLGNGLTPLPYLEYVKLIVARYKDSTAIAMWEPINEPESSDCVGAKGSACYTKQTCYDEVAATKALRSFFDTVGVEIKKIDKNHLVQSGVIGEGQCGAIFEDYKYVHESAGIDVASYHDYGKDDQPMPGDQWNGLQKRLNQMKQINKPLIIGEVGMLARDNTSGCMSYATRRDKLKAKMDAQFAAGVAGFLPWSLTGGASQSCNYDIVTNDPTLVLLREFPALMGPATPRPSMTPTPTPVPTPSPTPTPKPVPDSQAPTPPSNLTVTVTSPTQVTLKWNASTDNVGVIRYDIFRNNAYLSSTGGTSFPNGGLTPTSRYTYHVKSKDAAGNNSQSSNSVTIVPQPTPTPVPTPIPTPTPTPVPDTQAPTPPSNLTATAISPNQVSLSWNASTDNVGVIRYDIFRNNNYLTSTGGTSFTNTGLTPSTSYTYHVKGKDAAGNNSQSSNNASVTTLP